MIVGSTQLTLTLKRAAMFGIPHATTDRADAFARGDVDIVAVTTPGEPFITELLHFSDAGLDGLLRAGLAHAWFELLRPFECGNGRVGRAVLDRALAQDEGSAERLYSMSARLLAVRDDYCAALERLGRGGLDVTDWLRWFLEQFTHAVRDMLRQRVYGLALGWEDLNDHKSLRQDVAMQTAVGVDREVASAPTLCRLEKWADRATAVRLSELLVEQFIASFDRAPEELVLDFDATDNPLHGQQEQRFFHWELEFPEVFFGEHKGFHVIVGNPPWDKVLPDRQEFYGRYDIFIRALSVFTPSRIFSFGSLRPPSPRKRRTA